MTRIRTYKPELLRHEVLFSAERQTQLPLRIAFVGLFSCCDREGHFRWRPCQLKLDVLPYDDINFEDVLNVLHSKGFIKKYTHNDEYYGYIPTWSKHQYINSRESASTLPDPNTCTHVHAQNFHEQSPSTNIQCVSPHEADPASLSSRLNDQSSDEANFTSTNAEKNLVNADEILVLPTDEKSNDVFLHAHVLDTHVHARGEMELEMELEREVEKETEGEGVQGKGKFFSPPVAQARPRDDTTQITIKIFEFWKATFEHTNAKLDNKRQRLIRQALKLGYTPQQLHQAITGCSYTPHNRGDNDRGQRYDGLHVILRDADQIDRFIANYHTPPRPLNIAEQKQKANAFTLQQWINKKTNENGTHERE